MVRKLCLRICLLFVILCIVLAARPVWASPTGLNNIPTADVVPERVLVFQYYNNLGQDNIPDHFTGFKYGLMRNVEIGLDGRILPEKGEQENLVAQAKMRFEFSEQLSMAIGVANLGDRDRAGAEFPYGVLTYDLGSAVRIHFGGTSQNNNEGFFGGIDKTIKFLDRDLMFRADVIQVNDQTDNLSSLGFIYDLGNNFLIESWVSFPTETGKEEFYTLKLNYVIKF